MRYDLKPLLHVSLMSKFWLGVAKHEGSRTMEGGPTWWCLPGNASPGDRLLLYRARSGAATRSGLFAEYEVARLGTPPAAGSGSPGELAAGGYCSGPLVYSELALVRRIEPRLTATAMRKDLMLTQAQFLKRNFQGTVFELKKHEYIRLVALSTPND
jgi:hypothetical protein